MARPAQAGRALGKPRAAKGVSALTGDDPSRKEEGYGRRRGPTWLRQAWGRCPLARCKGLPPKTTDEIAL